MGAGASVEGFLHSPSSWRYYSALSRRGESLQLAGPRACLAFHRQTDARRARAGMHGERPLGDAAARMLALTSLGASSHRPLPSATLRRSLSRLHGALPELTWVKSAFFLIPAVMKVRSASFNPPKFYFPLKPLQGLWEHAHKSSRNVADSTPSSSDAAGNYVSQPYLLRTPSVPPPPSPEASDSKCIRFDCAALRRLLRAACSGGRCGSFP